MTLALGVLISGGGTNLQAILDAVREGRLDADVKVVISNVEGAFGLERARQAGVKALVINHRQFESREAFDEALIAALKEHGVEYVALAGFMRVLRGRFLEEFRDRTINIHPSLLPAFPGVDAQKQAFDYGVRFAGCTVHFVEPTVDSGPIITQRVVPVLEGDTSETLRQRILAEEHVAFVEALRWISEGRVQIEVGPSGRRVTRILPPAVSE